MMADIIQAGKVSVCRKPRILFNDGEHFPIEISFNREITDHELTAIVALAQVIDEAQYDIHNSRVSQKENVT